VRLFSVFTSPTLADIVKDDDCHQEGGCED